MHTAERACAFLSSPVEQAGSKIPPGETNKKAGCHLSGHARFVTPPNPRFSSEVVSGAVRERQRPLPLVRDVVAQPLPLEPLSVGENADAVPVSETSVPTFVTAGHGASA